MRAAFDLSLNIPRDLSVLGFDDIRLAQFMIPPLTTVQMSQAEIANLSFSALLDCLEPARHGNVGRVYSIRTNLVLRCSTALAPGCLRNRAATGGSGADTNQRWPRVCHRGRIEAAQLEPPPTNPSVRPSDFNPYNVRQYAMRGAILDDT
jgi:hypothetical protein